MENLQNDNINNNDTNENHLSSEKRPTKIKAHNRHPSKHGHTQEVPDIA